MTLPAALAEWSFDEASGDALDVTGNGHSFALDASLTRQAGHTNTGLRHESTAANSPGPAIFGQTAQRSLMAWVKRTTAVDGWLLEMKKLDADTGLWGFLYSGTALQARAKNASNTATFASVAQPSLNVWHHLAATYDGTTIRLYIDGTQAATAAFAGPIWTAATTFPVFDNTGSETIIDDARVYDVALTAAQISEAMSTPVGAPPPAEAHSGNLALTGSGSLALSGAASFSGTLAATGDGSAALVAAPALGGSRDATGDGQLAASGSPALAATRTFSGSGGFGTAGDIALPVDLAASGSGALAASGLLAVSGSLALSGSGSLALAPYVAPSFADLTLSAAMADNRWSASPDDTRWSAAMDPNPWTGAVES